MKSGIFFFFKSGIFVLLIDGSPWAMKSFGHMGHTLQMLIG